MIMKKIGILLIGILIISYNQAKRGNQKTVIESTNTIKKSKNFDWLLGKWKRLKEEEEEGKETFENWKKIIYTRFWW